MMPEQGRNTAAVIFEAPIGGNIMAENATSPFDLLFEVQDLVPLVFDRLDPSSLALVACVDRKCREAARRARGANEPRFRLIFADLVHVALALVWAIQNLGKKDLPYLMRLNMCVVAASKGALEALQWAHANGYGSFRWVCMAAAGAGRLGILRWARANGCPWDEHTCDVAAEGGHLVVLQWARENGCPWNSTKCLEMTKNPAIRAWIMLQTD